MNNTRCGCTAQSNGGKHKRLYDTSRLWGRPMGYCPRFLVETYFKSSLEIEKQKSPREILLEGYLWQKSSSQNAGPQQFTLELQLLKREKLKNIMQQLFHYTTKKKREDLRQNPKKLTRYN